MAELAETGPVSDDLSRWLEGDGPKTLDGLIGVFEEKSFALLFVILLGLPSPVTRRTSSAMPTGGATHVFEIIAVLLALQLIAGRDDIWLPARWRRLQLAGGRREKFINGLLTLIRRLERLSRPRGRSLFDHRLSNVVFGVLVIGGSVGAFLAPPFSGLDTLPALGVVLLSLGVLLEDVLVVIAGTAIGGAGVLVEFVLGSVVVHAVKSLF